MNIAHFVKKRGYLCEFNLKLTVSYLEIGKVLLYLVFSFSLRKVVCELDGKTGMGFCLRQKDQSGGKDVTGKLG